MIHEGQKSDISAAIDAGNQKKIDKVVDQRSQLHPLTSYLYRLKSGSGVTLTNKEGQSFTFVAQSPLGWLNLMWGEEEFYRFPMKDTFLEVDFTFNQTGSLKQNTYVADSADKVFPTYFYDGDNFLSELGYKDTGMGIVDLNNSDLQRYFFFDLSGDVIKNKSTTIGFIDGQVTDLSNLYQTLSYSPGYFMTTLDKGFQYCQKVAAYIGEKYSDKEYPAIDCENASKGKFSKEMHGHILEYATSLTGK